MTATASPQSPNRRARKRGQPAPAKLAAAFLAAALTVSVLVYLALTAQRVVPVLSYYNLKADFRNAANLDSYAEVRIDGKRIGQVIGTSYRDGIAQVDLQLHGIRPLPVDSTARIRLEGLLGATFVQLIPGRDRTTLAPGATIPARQTSTTVSLFDVIGTFDTKRRASLRAAVRGLGEGFLGRGAQLNSALSDAPMVLRDTESFTGAVNARSGAAQRFFPSAESAAAAFDPVRWDLALGFEPEARALQPFADQRPAVQATLEQAPPALSATQAGLERTDPLLSQTAGFARAAIAMTKPAPAAFDASAALLRASPGPLRTARTLLRHAAAAIPPTLTLLSGLDPLISPAIRSLRNQIPGLDALGIRACDVLGTLANWRDVLAYGIPGGQIGPVDVFRVELYAAADSAGDTAAKPRSDVSHDRNPTPCTAAFEHQPLP